MYRRYENGTHIQAHTINRERRSQRSSLLATVRGGGGLAMVAVRREGGRRGYGGHVAERRAGHRCYGGRQTKAAYVVARMRHNGYSSVRGRHPEEQVEVAQTSVPVVSKAYSARQAIRPARRCRLRMFAARKHNKVTW